MKKRPVLTKIVTLKSFATINEDKSQPSVSPIYLRNNSFHTTISTALLSR